MRNWFIMGTAEGVLTLVGSMTLPPVMMVEGWRVTWGPFNSREEAESATMAGDLEKVHARFQAPVPGEGLAKLMLLAVAQNADLFIGYQGYEVVETAATFDYEAWSGSHDR